MSKISSEKDWRDRFLEALRKDPDFAREVRKIVLTDELIELPAKVSELIAVEKSLTNVVKDLAQKMNSLTADVITLFKRYDELMRTMNNLIARVDGLTNRVEKLTQRMDELTGGVEELFKRVNELFKRVDQLTARVDELFKRVDELFKRVDQLTARVDELFKRVDQLTARVDELFKRVDQLTARVDELFKRMDQLTARVDGLTKRVDDLTVRVEELFKRVDELTADVKNIFKGLGELTEKVSKLTDRMDAIWAKYDKEVGELKGYVKEIWIAQRAHAIFGKLIVKGREFREAADILLDALKRGEISEHERDRILDTDVLWKGEYEGVSIVFTVEVSYTIGEIDVLRAKESARILRKIGIFSIPVVAGTNSSVQDDEVIFILDGSVEREKFKKLFEKLSQSGEVSKVI